MSTKVIFFGNERLSTSLAPSNTHTLHNLIESNAYDVAGVVASNTIARSRKQRQLEVATLAKAHNIPVFLPKKLTDIEEDLRELQAQIGILVAFGKVVPQSTIDLFAKGIINVHPSRLPERRGPTPIEQAILDGDELLTVSLMRLSAALDEGPVYSQEQLPITLDMTKAEITDLANRTGAEMLMRDLPSILDESLATNEQDHAKATYTRRITKQDGRIDWQKSAQYLEREIRAYADWPGSVAKIADRDAVITKARRESHEFSSEPGEVQANPSQGVIMVQCGEGSLAIEELKPAGKGVMTARDFANGYLR